MNSHNIVQTWMTPNPITIDESTSIIEAIHLMKEKNIRRLPVMKKGHFVGLVTDRMIREYVPGKATSLDSWEVHYLLAKTLVQEVMNPKPYTVSPETPLATAAQMFLDHKLYGLCVLDSQGELVGIMSVGDILKAVVALSRA
jgi:acetoin utilization protein AcuB